MKTYHGERTERGCEVTVDGHPLPARSDLSGCATGAFDWGFIGGGQLSMAMLADFLGDSRKVKALYEAFEKAVIAELPRGSWTLTGQDLANALARLPRTDVDGASNVDDAAAGGAAFGDMPIGGKTLGPPGEDARGAADDGDRRDRGRRSGA